MINPSLTIIVSAHDRHFGFDTERWNKQTHPSTQEIVRTRNPNGERAKERFFYQSCSNSNIHLSFNALKVIKYAKMHKNYSKKIHIFVESCPKFKKLLKMEKVAQKLPSRICLGPQCISTPSVQFEKFLASKEKINAALLMEECQKYERLYNKFRRTTKTLKLEQTAGKRWSKSLTLITKKPTRSTGTFDRRL